jgi:hypothetical protein
MNKGFAELNTDFVQVYLSYLKYATIRLKKTSSLF